MSVQDYELLLRVRTDLMEAMSGLTGLTDKLGAGDSAAKKLGETADEASDRIRKMVQASRDQAQAQQASNAALKQAGQDAGAISRNYDEQAGAIKRAAAAQTDYNRSFNQAGGGGAANTQRSTAALAAQRSEMAALANQIDPTIKALARLDAQERQLNTMRSKGVVGLDDYQRFKGLIDQSRESLTSAGSAAHTFSLNTAQARLEMGRLLKDVATGQWERLGQTSMTLASQSGLMSVLFNPLSLAIAAVVGSLGAFVVAAEQVAAENDKLNRSIQSTGNFAGETVSGVNKMAASITSANGSIGTSRDVLNQLVASGKVGSQALQSMGQAAVDMAELTGQGAEKATAAVMQMFDGTTASLLKANEQYHFLTTAVYDQIVALEAEGDTQAAMDVAARAFHAAAVERIQSMNSELSGLARWWDSVKTAAGNAWERMKTGASVVLGTADLQTQIYALMGQKAGAESGNPFTFSSWSPADERKLQDLQKRLQEQTDKAELAQSRAELSTGAVDAKADLDRMGQSLDRNKAKQAELNKLQADFLKLWKGAEPGDASLAGVQAVTDEKGKTTFSGGLYDQYVADINKRYDAKTPKAKSDAGALSAQQQLIKLLNDEQGALDPVAKAWATYNDKVQQANELATKAKTARGADVAAINAQRDAVVQLAAQVRDAAIDKETAKARQEWEKFRDALQSTDAGHVNIARISDDIQKLNAWLAQGTITAQEYQAALVGALDRGAKQQPKYKGIDGAVGGPFSEMDKNNRATEDEDQWFQQEMARINSERAAQLGNQAAWDELELQAKQKHSAAMAKIDQDRQRLMMIGITASLAQGAEAIKAGFGAQSNAYRAAFALSKAAAVAQATVNMFLDISQASAKGWPMNIPLIAQAMGEGLSIIGSIRSISAGYATGGYTGPGGKYEYAGPAHKGEVIWSQDDVARAGGWRAVDAMRRGAGFAIGGYTGVPAANSGDFGVPTSGRPVAASPGAAAGSGGGARLRIVNVVSPEHMNDWATSSEGEEVLMNMLGRNRTVLKTLVNS